MQITPGTGATISSDDVGGVQVQRVKVQYGADGSATDVSASTPLPVDTSNLATAGAPEAAVSVTTTATLVQAANSSRKEVRFQPTNGDVYWGTDNTVTTANGIRVASGVVWIEDRWDGTIYAIAASTVDVRRVEFT